MPDFSLDEEMGEGLDFVKIFKALFLYAVSIFIAFHWKGIFDETLETFMPKGTNIIEKIIIGLVITILLVSISYFLLHKKKKDKSDKGGVI